MPLPGEGYTGSPPPTHACARNRLFYKRDGGGNIIDTPEEMKLPPSGESIPKLRQSSRDMYRYLYERKIYRSPPWSTSTRVIYRGHHAEQAG